MTTTIASVNCYGGFLNTNPKILQTFFTYILEAQQFTLAKVTLNQVLSTQVNSSRLDKVQNMPVEKILSGDFFSLELVNGEQIQFFHHHFSKKLRQISKKPKRSCIVWCSCEFISKHEIFLSMKKTVKKLFLASFLTTGFSAQVTYKDPNFL